MHEWALAESVMAAALEAAQKEKLKTIDEIDIAVGELQQIEQDIFEFAIQEIIKTQTPELKQTKISITIEKSTLTCKNCGHSWRFDHIKKQLSKDESEAIHFIPEVAFVHTRCPHCKSPDFEITSGRGVSIRSITGKK